MDFKIVFSKLLTAFEEQDVRYALMGGFAMGLWGVARSTVDLDFLVRREDMPKVDKIMAGMGYELRHHSENVSQYVSPLRVMGEVDFLHAFREASVEMLKRAADKKIFNGSLTVRTLRPEDLIGLKLQAIKNNPQREGNDMADIRTLIQSQKTGLDWELVRGYCEILKMQDVFEELRGDAE
ncbi:MAG: nucleotidyl transferase AbiEii/AbiGii toxin family protein [Nitrospiraceae bacterium]|nr:nucleotidyl transferase AbiEii/AbiGii toxin family protein [Nitrospiraceae bacterium]